MENYLLMCTCTHLHVNVKYRGVGVPVAQGGIGHRALKYMKNNRNQHEYKGFKQLCKQKSMKIRKF